MTDRELKKLNRAELLEVFLIQSKRVEELESQVEKLRSQLEEQSIAIGQAGSIAEAALRLNGVFEASQRAADQYLENVVQLSEESKELRDNAARLYRATVEKCTAMESQTREKCQTAEKETQEKCDRLISEAKSYWERIWQLGEDKT